jgi:hypothetical protein
MPAQLANESFRADHVRFGNSVGAVVQVLMRSDVPAAEAFFRDHLRGVQDGADLGEGALMDRNPSIGKCKAISTTNAAAFRSCAVYRLMEVADSDLRREGDKTMALSRLLGDPRCDLPRPHKRLPNREALA